MKSLSDAHLQELAEALRTLTASPIVGVDAGELVCCALRLEKAALDEIAERNAARLNETTKRLALLLRRDAEPKAAE